MRTFRAYRRYEYQVGIYIFFNHIYILFLIYNPIYLKIMWFCGFIFDKKYFEIMHYQVIFIDTNTFLKVTRAKQIINKHTYNKSSSIDWLSDQLPTLIPTHQFIRTFKRVLIDNLI